MELLDNNQPIDGNFVNINHGMISDGRLRALKKRGTELNQLDHTGQDGTMWVKSAQVPGKIRLLKRMDNNQVVDRIFVNPNYNVISNARLRALKKRGKKLEAQASASGNIRLLKRGK